MISSEGKAEAICSQDHRQQEIPYMAAGQPDLAQEQQLTFEREETEEQQYNN